MRIGTAGWRLPKRFAELFPEAGSHLERYAEVFPAVEVNSSFYRPHRRSTWERWGAAVPSGFRFSAKAPRTLTHERRLADPEAPLEAFLSEVTGLGERLGPLLVQMPPSLAFEPAVAERFFRSFRDRFRGPLAAEPRHPTWFAPDAESLLAAWEVARVAADPVCAPGADEPGGWRGFAYFRLHGSPRMYYSGYAPEYLDALVDRMNAARAGTAAGCEVWCIFDNTALDEATGDAAGILGRLGMAAGWEGGVRP